MPNAWFTLDANIAVDTPVCTNAFSHHDDDFNSFSDYYRDVASAMTTDDEQTYNVCISNTNGSDATAGAKMNTTWRYTYSWDAPPPELTQNDWRWYINADNKQPTVAKASPKTEISDVNIGDILRIRMNVGISNSNILASTMSHKLQYGWGADCTTLDNWTKQCGVLLYLLTHHILLTKRTIFEKRQRRCSFNTKRHTAITNEEFCRWGHAIIDWIADY